MRRGCEERRIGLDKDTVRRRDTEGITQVLSVLEGYGAGERQVGPAVQALTREGGIAGEAVHDDSVRHALVIEHREDVVVRVAVVDHQRLVVPLRHADVLTERRVLGLTAGLSRPEVVKTRLANGTYVRRLRQRVDLGERLVEVTLLGVLRRLVGVQRDGGDHRVVRLGGRDGPARTLEIAADLHDPGDADGCCPVERLVDRDQQSPLDTFGVRPMVEVTVVVDDRGRQGLRRHRPAPGERHSAAASMRGNSDAGLVIVAPAGS